LNLVRAVCLVAACGATWQVALAASDRELFKKGWSNGDFPAYKAQEVDPSKFFDLQKAPTSGTEQEVDPGVVLPRPKTPPPSTPPTNPFENPGKKGQTDWQLIGQVRPMVSAIGRGFESDAVRAAAQPPRCGAEPIPFALLRSVVFYVRSKDGLACSASVRNIQSLKETFGAESGTLRDPAYLADETHVAVRRMVEGYVNDCSKTLQESAVAQLLGPDNTTLAAKNIGVLTTPWQRCMASIIGGRVLTARHCLAVAEEQDGVHALIDRESALDFETLSGDKYQLSFDGADVSPLRESARDRDWIVLGIKGGLHRPPGEALGYAPKLADLWRPLVLVSMSPYAMALRNDYRSSDQNAVIDISPICDILARDGSYIFHACQTLAGMSGAPLMTIEDGRLTVVGVHTGDASAVDTQCARNVAHRFPNYGIIPPENLGSEQ